MKRIKVTEKQYDKIISQLYESTYNSASDKVMEESDLDYWKDYVESKKQSDERAEEGGILGKLLSDTKMDKNENVYTKWFPTRFAVEALMVESDAYMLLYKKFKQYCKKEFGLMDKADIYMIWLDYTHSVVKMIPDQTVLKELYKSTYNSAASEAMEKGDEELSVDRFDVRQRIQSELNTMLNEGSKGENYMFFSNLKQMRRQLDIMINEFDSNMVNDVLNNGHDWADDHITEAKVNIDQVFDFFMNKLKDGDGEYKDEDDEFEFPVDNDYDDTEDYYTSHDKYGNTINDYMK